MQQGDRKIGAEQIIAALKLGKELLNEFDPLIKSMIAHARVDL